LILGCGGGGGDDGFGLNFALVVSCVIVSALTCLRRLPHGTPRRLTLAGLCVLAATDGSLQSTVIVAITCGTAIALTLDSSTGGAAGVSERYQQSGVGNAARSSQAMEEAPMATDPSAFYTAPGACFNGSVYPAPERATLTVAQETKRTQFQQALAAAEASRLGSPAAATAAGGAAGRHAAAGHTDGAIWCEHRLGTLKRFLAARGWDLAKAQAMLLATAEWRLAMGVEDCLDGERQVEVARQELGGRMRLRNAPPRMPNGGAAAGGGGGGGGGDGDEGRLYHFDGKEGYHFDRTFMLELCAAFGHGCHGRTKCGALLYIERTGHIDPAKVGGSHWVVLGGGACGGEWALQGRALPEGEWTTAATATAGLSRPPSSGHPPWTHWTPANPPSP
jgi:hypothetical protein